MSEKRNFIDYVKEWFAGVDFKSTWKAIPHKGYIYCLLFMLLIIALKPLFSLSGEKKESGGDYAAMYEEWASRHGVPDAERVTVIDVARESELGVLLNARERAYWNARSMMLFRLSDYATQPRDRRDFEKRMTRSDIARLEAVDPKSAVDSINLALARERIRRMEEYDAAPKAFRMEALEDEQAAVKERLARLSEGEGTRIKIEASVRDTLVGFVFYIFDGRDSLELFSVYNPEASMDNPFEVSDADKEKYESLNGQG